ncbi:type II secretion system F family protein, partial [Vibrio parahaemolyticus]|nr:type II secretion system F family protein [Vibrio parahaemolyticus]
PNKQMADTLESLAPLTSPTSEQDRQPTRNKLLHAGFPQSNSLSMFYAIKSITSILGSMIAVLVYLTVPESKDLYTYMALSAFIGLLL